MSEKITLDKIEENLTFFNKMYDIVRIVDPVCKKVLESSDMSLEQTDEVCYEYWKDGRICENCISIRAYYENKTFIKLEYTENTTMLVTAMPVEGPEPTVIELLKNATDTMLIGEGDYNEGRMIRKMVKDLNKRVIEDPLTSLNNRRFINERLPADIVKATIEAWPLSMIFVDIDNLKYINDTYGHTVGDGILKEAASVLLQCIRYDTDWTARYAGDEFIICLNNTDNSGAQVVADRIRKSIEEIQLPIDDVFINLSVSIGIYTMKEEKLTAEELIHAADKNMYESKRARKTTSLI